MRAFLVRFARCSALPLLPGLLLLLLLSPTPARAQTGSACSVNVLYFARDKADISYSFVAWDAPLTLQAVSSGGSTITVAGPLTSGAGSQRLSGLAGGSWSLRLSDGTPCVGGSFTIGANVAGTPLMADTVAGGEAGEIDVSITAQSGAFTVGNVKVMGSLYLTSVGGAISVSNSTVLGLVQIYGNGISLRNNQIIGQIVISDRSNVAIENNVLMNAIDLYGSFDEVNLIPVCGGWCEPGVDPLITGNSFVGRYALTARDAAAFWGEMDHKVPVGCNFYGHPFAYTTAVDSGPGPYLDLPFLAYTGAYVDTEHFEANCKNTEGRYPSPEIFPTIWAESWIGGQNVLLHSNASFVPDGMAVTGRNSLLSVDVRSTREILTGTKFYVMWRGERIDSLPTNVRRWYTSYKGRDGFEKTVNFVLPPVDVSDEEFVTVTDCTVYADISGVEGTIKRPAGPLVLTHCRFRFTRPPSRPFRVLVMPVNVIGACSGRASTSGVVASLRGLFAGIAPVRPNDIRVDVGPPLSFVCGDLEAATATGFWSMVNSKLAIQDAVTRHQKSYDRIIAVIPKFTNAEDWDIQGSNSPLNRTLLLVREDQPEAMLHEMGHSLFLADNYTKKGSGVLLRGLTAFDPELRFTLGIGRGEHYWTAEQIPRIFDIMGDNNMMWPNNTSFSAYRGYFSSLASAGSEPEAQQAAPVEPASADARTLFLSAHMEYSYNAWYTINSRSLSAFDITGTGLNPGGTPQYDWDTRFYYYYLEVFDAAGQMIGQIDFLPHSWYTFFYQTVSVPNGAVTLRLKSPEWHAPVVWHKDPHFAATLAAPAPGAALTDTLTLRWEQSRGDLEHLVLYSLDNGATWQAISPPFKGSSVELSTDFLPSGVPIILRALTSDGFQNAETRVAGLTVSNRAPTATILFPPDGAQAEPGFAWMLDGLAGDVEDLTGDATGDITGRWRSSRDGDLHPEATADGVVLSPGDHVLTFSVVDSQGRTAQDQVTVSVAPVTAADLALGPDSFTALADGYDEWIQRSTYQLTTGVTNTLRLQLVGAGLPMTATVALHGVAPSGARSLLGRATLEMPEFGAGELKLAFVPPESGVYRFEGRIESASLPDPNAANNHFTWSAPVYVPGEPDIFLPYVVIAR